MNLINNLSNQKIIEYLNTYYELNVIKLFRLPFGADMNALVFKADTKDKLSYFIKLKLVPYNNINMDIIALLHHNGIQPIILPIKTKQGLLFQSVDNYTLIVYPFVEGENGFHRHLTDEHWQLLGSTLRQIHEIDIPSSLRARMTQENFSPKWRNIMRSVLTFNTTATPEGLQLKFLAFLKKHLNTIQCLVDRADKLAQKFQQQTHPFVLCHTDIHGGNILINNDNALFIIDWDEPLLAPKERDLMFIGGGVGNTWNTAREEALFYKGYGSTQINQEMLAYYRHERIVEDMAIFSQEILSVNSEENRQQAYKYFISMFGPNDVVEIAVKTR